MRGNVGIIACPMLEDELIFALASDNSKKSVYVVDNGNCFTILPKMKQYGVPYSIMSEYELNSSMDLDSGFNIIIIMKPANLHNEPEKLRKTIEDDLLFYQSRFDVIAVYYGMCGNYGWDISTWAKEKLDVPVVTFKDCEGKVCDDCVGVAVGGTAEYYKLVKNYTGVLYLTPSTATNWGLYPDSNEQWKRYYNSRDDLMKELFKLGNYKFAMKIDTGLGDRKNYQKCCQNVADKMELELIEPNEKIATTKLALKIFDDLKAILTT
ncbi:MAG: DUF1638 domain-containing protein [archaeon]|nr:DUF1638 domain-containing protein [archaeon]